MDDNLIKLIEKLTNQMFIMSEQMKDMSCVMKIMSNVIELHENRMQELEKENK